MGMSIGGSLESSRSGLTGYTLRLLMNHAATSVSKTRHIMRKHEERHENLCVYVCVCACVCVCVCVHVYVGVGVHVYVGVCIESQAS